MSHLFLFVSLFNTEMTMFILPYRHLFLQQWIHLLVAFSFYPNEERTCHIIYEYLLKYMFKHLLIYIMLHTFTYKQADIRQE